MTPLTAKDMMLPPASPPTRQKLATVAAVSTSSRRPFRFGLRSALGAAIIPRVLSHPLLTANASMRNMNPASGIAPAVGSAPEVCTLHNKNSGMNTTRRAEKMRRRGPDQMIKAGKEQRSRPNKSPMLNTKKCADVKSSGCVFGFKGLTATVMGGKTDYNAPSVSSGVMAKSRK